MESIKAGANFPSVAERNLKLMALLSMEVQSGSSIQETPTMSGRKMKTEIRREKFIAQI